ncbi:hypothetical protein GOBAR_DD06914 [Gossypium barbadense]|nr:hypothetical protein GOBAR_DD06914 [Gossypium barbadense]
MQTHVSFQQTVYQPLSSTIHAISRPLLFLTFLSTRQPRIPRLMTKKVPPNEREVVATGAKQGIPRKENRKKDRHKQDLSTAHGPRDRRMRIVHFKLPGLLSRNFTGKLPALNEGGKSVSSTSESEVVFRAAKECQDNMGDPAREAMRSTTYKTSRKVSFNHIILKKQIKCSDESSNPNELEELQSSSLLEIGRKIRTVEKSWASQRSSSILKGRKLSENSGSHYSYCEQNPSINFHDGPYEQEGKSLVQVLCPIKYQAENSTTNLIANSYAKMMNHNSDLTNPSNAHEGRNPTSILMSSSHIGLHSDYHENPAVASKFHHFYL